MSPTPITAKSHGASRIKSSRSVSVIIATTRSATRALVSAPVPLPSCPAADDVNCSAVSGSVNVESVLTCLEKGTGGGVREGDREWQTEHKTVIIQTHTHTHNRMAYRDRVMPPIEAPIPSPDASASQSPPSSELLRSATAASAAALGVIDRPSAFS